jgi:hypothetical protein
MGITRFGIFGPKSRSVNICSQRSDFVPNRANPEQCSPNTNKRSDTPNKCSDLPNKCSGTKHQEPNTWYLVPGTRYRVPGTRYLVLGTRYSTRTSVQVFRTSAFRCSEQRTLNTNTEQSEQCSASALDGNNGLYWKARAWWCGIRRIREGQNSGTWHDLVPGTTWQIRYLASFQMEIQEFAKWAPRENNGTYSPPHLNDLPHQGGVARTLFVRASSSKN